MDRLPLDHPTPERPHRLYVALTNHCNRSCPWCSTCSSPAGGTYLTLDAFERTLPEKGFFEVQLEGGEPTLHPQFWDFVELARAHARTTRMILCTNGTRCPRTPSALNDWLERFGDAFTLKLSINHYLLEHDPALVELAKTLVDIFNSGSNNRLLVLNVRLRKGYENDDEKVYQQVADAGLLPHANVFFLQRYGFAAEEETWDEPFLAGHNFRMINPDGTVFGADLIARSEAMRALT